MVRNAFSTGGAISATTSAKNTPGQVNQSQEPAAVVQQSVPQQPEPQQQPPALPVEQPPAQPPVQPEPQQASQVQASQVQASQPALQVEQPAEPTIDSSTRLDIFEQIVSDLKAQQTQPEPEPQIQQMPQPTSDTLNPPNAISSAKEKIESTSSPDVVAPDSGTGIQYVEQEKNPEIPVEVESFLQHAEDHANQTPQEIVIADGSQLQSTKHLPKKPVFVLPITEEIEKEGEKKSPKYSIRWLVEWSHKVIKMFAGKVIYREAPTES